MIQSFKDFFILVHNEDWEPLSPVLPQGLIDSLQEEGIDLYTVLLACNARNFEVYAKIEFLQEKSQAWLGENLSLEGIKLLQLATLTLLVEFPSSRIFQEILDRLARLKKEGVLLYEEEQRIRAIMHQLIPAHAESQNSSSTLAFESSGDIFEESFLKSGLQRIDRVIEAFHRSFPEHRATEELERVRGELESQKFSIGVTGVMSAGKSTMLNAILQREILGTSVIPETANLTILRFDQNERAIVRFWNRHEWEMIAQSAQFDEGIDYFMKESLTVFGTVLHEYITQEGRTYEIPLEELSTYTSAKHPSKLCNLVKSVEIFTPLEFLDDGVEIVDTPGLDDPLTQREEITKEYLARCDVMLHLMNAAQPATQKDVDFIIDALIYQNVSRLLVILTRADSLTPQELQQSMNYTISSIRERLWVYNQKASFEEITERLDFLPIAAKLALLHRTGKGEEALEKGYELEDTGILKVESYLREMLFGPKAQKPRTLLYGACKEMLRLFETLFKEIELQKHFLAESLESLKERLETLSQKERHIQGVIQEIQKAMQETRQNLIEYTQSLNSSVEFKLLETRNILQERVMDDVNYEFGKERKPTSARLENMIELGIRDGIADTARDYRHKFAKKLHFLTQEMEAEFAKLSDLLPLEFLEETLRSFNGILGDDLKEGRFIESGSILKKSVASSVAKYSKPNDEKLEQELRGAFEFSFRSLIQSAHQKTEELNIRLLERFDTIIAKLYKEAQSVLERNRALLAQEILQKEQSEGKREQQEKELLFQEEVLLNAQEEIEKLLKEVA